jgi:soluble lytic murein transglycosylase-like protein
MVLRNRVKLVTIAAAAIAAGLLVLPDQTRAESNHQMLSSAKMKASTVRGRVGRKKAAAKRRAVKTLAAMGKQLNIPSPHSDGNTTSVVEIDLERAVIDGYPTGALPLHFFNALSETFNYSVIVARYASDYGVPAALVDAVIRVESNYSPNMRGNAGEIGLMQIKLGTARMVGYSGPMSGLFDPDTNIKYGTIYLAKAYKLSDGDTCGTILRYNAGHGATRMNRVSAAFCSKVKRVQAERSEFVASYLRAITGAALGLLTSLGS